MDFKNQRVTIKWKNNIDKFIANYVSSMQGVLYDESRQVLTNITLDYRSETNLENAGEKTTEISVNNKSANLPFVIDSSTSSKQSLFPVFSDFKVKIRAMFGKL